MINAAPVAAIKPTPATSFQFKFEALFHTLEATSDAHPASFAGVPRLWSDSIGAAGIFAFWRLLGAWAELLA
jgi:hypothetical protein